MTISLHVANTSNDQPISKQIVLPLVVSNEHADNLVTGAIIAGKCPQ